MEIKTSEDSVTYISDIEEGVMVMKDGKAWGVTYSDGQCTTYGWVDPSKGKIGKPEYLTKPTDLTYRGSPDTEKISQGKIVKVKRHTVVVASVDT